MKDEKIKSGHEGNAVLEALHFMLDFLGNLQTLIKIHKSEFERLPWPGLGHTPQVWLYHSADLGITATSVGLRHLNDRLPGGWNLYGSRNNAMGQQVLRSHPLECSAFQPESLPVAVRRQAIARPLEQLDGFFCKVIEFSIRNDSDCCGSGA